MWAMLRSFLGRGVKGAVGQSSEAKDDAIARIVDQFNGALLTRFKTNGRSRGNVESHAVGCRAVKSQSAIGLGKVIVRSHLNGAVAGVLNHQGAGSAANIQGMLALVYKKFTGCHGLAFKLE